jgi:Predicted membrane protein
MSWRGVVLRIMRVPADPEPPPGSPPRTFRAAPHYFALRLLGWCVAQLVLVLIPISLHAAIFVVHRDPSAPPLVLTGLGVLAAVAWAAFTLQLLLGWAVLRLDYELRWYMVSDRAIRIREGISIVKEKTMSLANIQNISIRQGPLQRLLGIADVEVRTAGGGSRSPHKGKKENPFAESMHTAWFRGVDNAEAIRDLLREGVRRQRDSGLGDPDDHHHIDDDLAGAARALHEEAVALRQLLQSQRA